MFKGRAKATVMITANVATLDFDKHRLRHSIVIKNGRKRKGLRVQYRENGPSCRRRRSRGKRRGLCSFGSVDVQSSERGQRRVRNVP